MNTINLAKFKRKKDNLATIKEEPNAFTEGLLNAGVDFTVRKMTPEEIEKEKVISADEDIHTYDPNDPFMVQKIMMRSKEAQEFYNSLVEKGNKEDTHSLKK